jgi:transcriptional repressor NrdR
MHCPFCRHGDSRVLDSREADEGRSIRRRRTCMECGRRFTTMEEAVLVVLKRCGVREPFSRSKIEAGVRKACQGRPVDDDALASLAQSVEEAIRAEGIHEVSSHDVGLAILGPLRSLDEVAYLRFASVYKNFESLADFEREIALLASIPGASGPPASILPPANATSRRSRTVMQLSSTALTSGSDSCHAGKGRGN